MIAFAKKLQKIKPGLAFEASRAAARSIAVGYLLRPFLVACIAVTGAAAEAEPRFKSASVPEHIYAGGWEHFVGGGVAAFDCNGDALPDLFAAGGENPASLFVNTTPGKGGDIRFVRSDAMPSITAVTGAYPIDIDGDGTLDIFVLRAGPNVVLRGKGDCRFEEVQALQNNGGNAWSTAFSATFEEGAKRPTLAVGNYVDRDDPKGPFRTCDTHVLHRPSGDRYGPPSEFGPGHCTLSMLFFDWTGDGERALWVSNDRHYYVDDGEEQLFRFTPDPTPYTAEEGWRQSRLWGMGIAARDLSDDGRPEVFVTSMADQKLFHLDGDGRSPAYASASYSRGTTAHIPYVGGEGRPSTGWHAEFGDFDNDGRDDLFIAKGNVDQMPDAAMKDPDNLLMQQPDGSFREFGETAGVASFARGRGAAIADFNGDGLLDIAVVNRRAPLLVHQNITADPGGAVTVRLRQSGANSMAIGAVIELRAADRTHRREITVGGGHAGGRAGFEHFGVGTTVSAELRVIWPNGDAGPWHPVSSGDDITIQRTGATEAVSVTDVRFAEPSESASGR